MQRYTKYNTAYMRDQLIRVHEAYQSIRCCSAHRYILLLCFSIRKKYEKKFDKEVPRALFQVLCVLCGTTRYYCLQGSYAAYREEGHALEEKFALQDSGLDCDPWEKFNLEYVALSTANLNQPSTF